MNDTIPFLGWAIKPIHLTAVYYAIWLFFGFFGTGFGIMAGWFHSRGNRHMDRYVESSCEISEPDRHGYRTLAIRNADMVFRLEDVIRGKNVRKWLLAAAYKCDWISRRFIEDPNPHHQELILEAVRNFLTRHCKEGVWARLNKSKTTVETTVIFAVTGSDIPVGGVRMIRVILVNAIELESVLTHPEDRWYFLYNPDFQENPEKKKHEDERYEVRLATLRTMARAYQNGGYHIGTDGTSVRIVDGVFSRVIV